MSAPLQGLIVALVVAFSLLYSTWRLLSARLRIRVLDLLARIPGLRDTAAFAALRARAVARLAAACGACAPAPKSAASRKQTPGALRRS